MDIVKTSERGIGTARGQANTNHARLARLPL